MGGPRYVLVLRPVPQAVPAVVRLRRLLKEVARYGFVCVSAEEEIPKKEPREKEDDHA